MFGEGIDGDGNQIQTRHLRRKQECNISSLISQGQAACGGGCASLNPSFSLAQETKILCIIFF
jgi:hypothetical protein